MTSRSYVLRLLAVGYASFTVSGSIVAAAVIARTASAEEITVFFSAAGILIMFAAFFGDLLAEAFERFWDEHWDENRVSWAVVEAERIAEQATQD